MAVDIATLRVKAPQTGRTRLGARTRKVVLMLHIVASGAWIGIDVVMGVLVFTSIFTQDDAVRALCYQALPVVTTWPLVISGLAALVTGVILGLGSKYGLVRYWWVAVKLALNLVLVALVLVALRPGTAELAEAGARLAAGERIAAPVGDMVFPPIVSGVSLVFAVILSVFKPWGRLRKR
jgi:hypothetical protein